MFQLGFYFATRKIQSIMIVAVLCSTGQVSGQYCGAQCVLKSCETLGAPKPDLVTMIKVLNGPELDRLPSLAQLKDYLSDLGLYTCLVDINVFWNLQMKGACVAIHHVNGNHFVVNTGVKDGVYEIWWDKDTKRGSHRSELHSISSSPVLIVSYKSPCKIEREVNSSLLMLRLWKICRFLLFIVAVIASLRIAYRVIVWILFHSRLLLKSGIRK